MDTGRFLYFCETLDGIIKDVKKLEMSYMRKYALRAVHMRCLLRMKQSERGMSVTELSRVCKLDKALISRILRELIDDGFVKTRGKSEDRTYNKKYYLTEKSEEIVGNVASDISSYIERAKNGIPPEDMQTFYAVLEALESNISKIEIK